MNEEILRLRALTKLQTADILALLSVCQQLAAALRPDFPNLPDVNDLFLSKRKEFVHYQLEKLETRDPAAAAALQQLIDDACSSDYGYES